MRVSFSQKRMLKRKTKGKQSKNDRMKKGKMVHPKKACSLSGNSNKVRYPEEIPKAYRRKGNKTEEDKRGQKTRGEDGRREEAFITKSALLPFQDWRTNKT